ncbi:MAG: hypothetical protein QM497_01180 [Sulfurimonas sp.]
MSVNAKVNYENKEVEIVDPEGNEVEEKGFKARAMGAVKKIAKYSPIGMSYTVGKGMMEVMDKALNDNDLNKVENITFDQVVNLIKEGKDSFEELHMTFTAAQSNGINIGRLKKEVNDQDVTIGLGKKGGIGLEIDVKYKK